MLRPASPALLARLVAAASADDRELDAALIALGVLPPLDLSEIRTVLRGDVTLRAGANHDGHRLIEIRSTGGTIGWIGPDGAVTGAARCAA